MSKESGISCAKCGKGLGHECGVKITTGWPELSKILDEHPEASFVEPTSEPCESAFKPFRAWVIVNAENPVLSADNLWSDYYNARQWVDERQGNFRLIEVEVKAVTPKGE